MVTDFMARKTSYKLFLPDDLKKETIELFHNLGMDVSTAVTLFLKQSVREHNFPFLITFDVPNDDTISAISEMKTMKEHPELYKKYNSFDEILEELNDDSEKNK